MKEFWQTMEKDIQEENFTQSEWFIYGIVAPMALFLTVILLAIIEDMVCGV